MQHTLIVLAVGSAVLFGLVVTTILTITERLGDHVTRLPDTFAGLEDVPRPSPADGTTFLLVGTDTRSDTPTTGRAARGPVTDRGRSDAVMIAHIAADGTSAAVVSIPRDSWVDIPGHGENKINAAYAIGGPSLLIRTVENLTGLRIDHFAVADFAGFQGVVDSVGGIDVGVAEATSDPGVELHEGVNHLDGAAALVYVRQRYGLADGDLDRARRQQNALRALVGKVAATGTANDPVGLYDLLDATTRFVSVDDTLSNEDLRSVTHRLRGVPPDEIRFLRAPVAGLDREDAQSVVRLDLLQARELWDSLRQDTTADYAERHVDDTLGPVTR